MLTTALATSRDHEKLPYSRDPYWLARHVHWWASLVSPRIETQRSPRRPNRWNGGHTGKQRQRIDQPHRSVFRIGASGGLIRFRASKVDRVCLRSKPCLYGHTPPKNRQRTVASNMPVVLITGCSSGFGKSIAARLAASDHIVYATMRSLAKKGKLAEELGERRTTARICRLDVTDDTSVEKVMNKVASEQGRIDVLVNNAGIGVGGFFEDLTENENREVMETNFFGVQRVTRWALPLLRNSHDGKIINMSSLSGFTGFPGLSAYHSSKWALEGFSESLRFELLAIGIKVHLIQPGSYDTEIFHKNRRMSVNFHPDDIRSKRIVRLVEDHPRSHRIEEISQTVEKIIDNRLKAFRIRCGRDAKLAAFLKRYVPFFLLEKFVMNRTSGRN